jgi:hypothetical protein
VLVVLAAWLVPAMAWAQARVVLAVMADTSEATASTQRRVGQELTLRGFEVLALTPSPVGDPLADTLALARAEGAAIGVVVALAADGGARISVVDRVTGKQLHRALPAERAGHERSMLALAVAELVDASLVELRLGPETAVGEIEAPRDLPVPAIPRSPRIGGRLGATLGLAWPVRHTSPVAVVFADVGLWPTRRVAILADVALPLHTLRRELPLATIRTLPFTFGLRTDVDVLPRGSPLRLDVQAGVSAVALRIEVDARPGAHARSQTVFTTAGLLGLGLHRTLGRRVTLGASARFVVPVEDVRITFDSRTAQRLGPVWVAGGITVGTHW